MREGWRDRASSRKSPKGGENRFTNIWGGLCHLLYNHVICIVEVSRG